MFGVKIALRVFRWSNKYGFFTKKYIPSASNTTRVFGLNLFTKIGKNYPINLSLPRPGPITQLVIAFYQENIAYIHF